MTTREQFDQAMAASPTEAGRILALGALLSSAIDDDLIVVGGSAIYLHAPELRPSLDVDLVTRDRAAASETLESWGFARKNRRVWRRSDLPMDVDLLTEFNGSRSRAVTIGTPYGTVRVASVEDLLLKRLIELKHWPTEPDWRHEILRQIDVLLREHRDDLDEEYLQDRARRENVEDVLREARAHA